MADAATVPLSAPHAPKPASIEAFKSAWPEIKNEFHKYRHKWDEHEPEMFVRVQGFTDHELLERVNLDKALVQVRTGESAYTPLKRDRLTGRYGLHLFGKIKIDKVDDAYIQVRLFVGDGGKEVKVHSVHTYEDLGMKKFTAIFHEKDDLEWFNE